MDPLIFEQLLLNKLGIPREKIEQARQQQAERGGSLRENLIALNVFTEETFAEKISTQLRVPYLDLKQMSIADDVLALLPREKAEKYLALPLELDARHRRLNLTMANPFDMAAIDDLKFVIGYTLILHYTPDDELSEAIQREYARFEEKQGLVVVGVAQPAAGDLQSAVIDLASLSTADTPIAQLIGAILTMAYSRQASEIHIDPNFDGIRVCFRIDGKISEIARLPRKLTSALLTRLKRILGGESGERARLFQKGHATLKLKNKKELEISYQLSPTAQSEHVLLKIKDRATLPVLEELDLESKARTDLQQGLDVPHGIVLVTGTAKSGLTTTLYTLLKLVSAPHKSIFSVEDPIECTLEGVTQGQIHEDDGHTYEQYLQYAAKQSPDVVMIDKIFDGTMVRDLLLLSAGALVLSSLASVDAASAAMKLVFMGDLRLVVDRVTCITSQRLVRRICERCKEEVTLADAYREKLGLAPEDHCYAGKGCEFCGYTGYKGIISLFEVMPLTEDVKKAITDWCPITDLRNLNASQHVLSLRDDGMRKVKQGVTTIQEVLKATIL